MKMHTALTIAGSDSSGVRLKWRNHAVFSMSRQVLTQMDVSQVFSELSPRNPSKCR